MKEFDCVRSGSDLIIVKLNVVGDMFFLSFEPQCGRRHFFLSFEPTVRQVAVCA